MLLQYRVALAGLIGLPMPLSVIFSEKPMPRVHIPDGDLQVWYELDLFGTCRNVFSATIST